MALRDQIFTPRMARVMTSASAIVAAGAGAAIGIVVGGGAIGALSLGALGWLVRVGAALPRRGDRPVRADDLPDPWRGFVRDAEDARRRFADAASATREGPLRDRLREIGGTIDHGVDECRRVAVHAAAISAARRKIDVPAIMREQSGLRNDGRPATAATRDALQAQLDTAARMDEVARDAKDRLRLLNARMDESVARAIELSVKAEDVSELDELGSGVGELVGQLEALRQALDEPALRGRPSS